MYHRLVVEDMEPDHWIAWVLDLPACFSSARTSVEAVAQAPRKIADYYLWVSKHEGLMPVPKEPIQVELVETFHSLPSKEDPEYLVNAFFDDDRRPLGYWDIVVAVRLLDWTRQDLLEVITSLDEHQLHKPIPTEVFGSIAGIIEHIAGAENWYYFHLGLDLERTRLPDDPLKQIETVRNNTQEQLWKLIGDIRITENSNELWSARKVVRRTLWHERDHTQHITKLLAGT
ncbi:MAG: DinB family protein [Anaerolineales bacterium]|nr:DinB family protein [Anaerolineales bacterium]